MGVEIGLLTIKFLNFGGKLLLQTFRILSGFFRFLLGGVFYKILVKIYYRLFRLKKNELAARTTRELTNNNLVYILIFCLTAGFIYTNIVNQGRASITNTKISQTIMAGLIYADSEFILPQEELVEEIMGPETLLAIGQEKYLSEPDIIAKNINSLPETEGYDELPAFHPSGDLVFKPIGIGRVQETDSQAPTQRTEIVEYEVQPGDTVSSIARRFNISINTILWANKLTAYSLIRPGDKLTILPYSGIVYTVKSGDTLSKIAAIYSIEMDKIDSANNLAGGLKAGQKIILPGAVQISTPQVAARPQASYTGISAIRDLIQAPAAKVSGDKMAWPTVGSRITQYFSWRHTGVDIANKLGTPLYAADDGVVETATGGYNGGYGNMIVINHGGGIKTRYAHASKLFVKAGDSVSKGDTIAAMGSTGRSTGSHIHFEVLINGVRKNPLNYIR